MILRPRNITAKITAGLAALFTVAALAGCKDDENNGTTSRPSGSRPIGDISHLDLQYMMPFDDIAVRTATGRTLRVTGYAFCQNDVAKSRTVAAYNEACRTTTGQNMIYAAQHEDAVSRFESFLPMGSHEIRPYNYFDKDMMLRALPATGKADLFTVTALHDCATGAPVAPLVLSQPRADDPYPAQAARKAAQTVTPAHGRVEKGACRF